MTVDPILALESLGYTRREAAFLYLVAAHSGYFLRRQFDYFVDRNDGHLAQRFIEKARAAGHIAVLDYGQRRQVHHLFYKQIYRLVGDAESQNRRRKGDAAIRARLISLDYVLGHENDRYFESAAERLRFFAEVRRIPVEHFSDGYGRLHPLLAAYPIAIADREHPVSTPVKLVFADEALMTIEKFKRFLSVTEPLLRSLGSVEVIYCSNSAQNFEAALGEFRKKFDAKPLNSQQSFGEEWRKNPPIAAQIDQPLQAKFTTLLFRSSYPKLRRDENASPNSTHPTESSERQQLLQMQQDGKNTGSNAGCGGGGSDPP
jgi:hypothetical protein